MTFLRLGALLLSVSLAGSQSPVVQAQTAAPRFVELPYSIRTGALANPSRQERVLHSFTVHVSGASSLRLFFDEVQLAGGLLRMTSVTDGAIQELDALQLRQWGLTSAYFNGDTVQVDVLVPALSGPAQVALEHVEAQLDPGFAQSVCGNDDDRAPSSDPRAARVLPIGCSSFLIDDCNHCLLSAGHCLGASFSMIEFDVPPSLANGNIVHPAPDKQYSIDPSSTQGFDGPVGDDWSYFGVFPNATTGLFPAEAQGNWYGLASEDPVLQPGAQLRVTGFGADATPDQNNQVQQTSWGPWTGVINSWELYYEVDTTAGSSGSPVLLGGVAIGIHTNGGCDTSLGNGGTSVTRPSLLDALANPRGMCAGTCDGFVTVYCEPKANSFGCEPQVSTAGSASLTAGAGSFTISATWIINQKPGRLFYGFAPNQASFLGGTLCVAPPLRRTPLVFSGGNAGPDDCSGSLSFDWGAWSASGIDPNLQLGETVYAQFHYRDPASVLVSPEGLSNAVAFELLP